MPRKQTPRAQTVRSRITGVATTFRLAPTEHIRKIRAFVKELEDFAKGDREGRPFDPKLYDDQFKKMEALDKEAKDRGSKLLGRLCSWPRGDGQAHYFVEAENGQVCRLIWIPIQDRYQSDAVMNGIAFKEVCEKNIRSHEGMKAIFSKE